MTGSTLLQYAEPATSPAPLSIGATGASVTLVASYPGGLNDEPSLDYIEVTSITFDFGVVGNDGSDLTDDATGIAVQGSQYNDPSGNQVTWSVCREGLSFKFTPPQGGSHVYPQVGLTFEFRNIAVNDATGSVNLEITEIAAVPAGNSSAAREAGFTLGKFPADFEVGQLVISPPSGKPEFSPSLSWTGSEGQYVLEYDKYTGSSAIKSHADGTPLQPNDTYPDTSKEDGSLSVDQDTLYTLTAYCTPDGSSDTLTTQRQAWAHVLQPTIEPGTFTASPQPVDYGEAVTLSWQTENADSCEISSNAGVAVVAANSSDQESPYTMTPVVDESIVLTAVSGSYKSNPVLITPMVFNPVTLGGISAYPSDSVNYGDSVELLWNVKSAVSVEINGSPVDGSSLIVNPTESQTYTIDCCGTDGTHLTDSVDVTVTVVTLSDVMYLAGGGTLDISWSGECQKSLDISFSWSRSGDSGGFNMSNIQIGEVTQSSPGKYSMSLPIQDMPSSLAGYTTTITLTVYGPGPAGQVKFSKTSTTVNR